MSLLESETNTATRLDALSDGRLVFIKTALTEQGRATLRKEAAAIEIGSMPGVVELVSYCEAVEIGAGAADTKRGELTTLYVGPRNLDTIADWTLADVVGTLSMLGTTIADLHDLGIVHGALTTEHVLVDQAHRPVVCGLGHGKVAEQLTPDDVATDAVSLGAIAGNLVSRVREPPRSAKRAIAEVERIAAEAQSCAGHGTPMSARTFAAEVAGIVLKPDAKASARPTSAHRRHIAFTIAAVCSAIAFVAAGWAVLGAGHSASAAPPPFASTTPSAEATATTDTPSLAHQQPCAAVSCPRQLSDGRVAAFGHTYTVGRSGDEVLLANWTCRNDVTAAVLRPSTGEIFFFANWATTADIVVRPVAHVADARQATITRDLKGCPALAVTTTGGTTLVVHPQLVNPQEIP